MADQNSLRSYRPHVPQSRAGTPVGSENGAAGDPLAELARLIGQTDPFADFEQNRLREEAQHATRHAAEPHESHQAQARASDQSPSAAGYDPAGHVSPEGAADQQGYNPHDQQAYRNYAYAQGEAYDQYPGEYDPEDYESDDEAYYLAEGQPLDDAVLHQQQEAASRRRRRLMLVAAIFGLAVVGSAGAYGYKTYVRGVGHAGPPPIIKAETTPTKVIPAAQSHDSANKLSYDRVGDHGASERVVPREEAPVRIKTVAIEAAPPPSGQMSAAATEFDCTAGHGDDTDRSTSGTRDNCSGSPAFARDVKPNTRCSGQAGPYRGNSSGYDRCERAHRRASPDACRIGAQTGTRRRSA